jgi:hypothetical protein
MYYRLAIQAAETPLWKWKSTALSSLDALFQLLRLYGALPQDRLRVFSSSSREEMNEQLERENQGFNLTSVTAAQFLEERKISSRGVGWREPAQAAQGNEKMTSIAVITKSPVTECGGEAQSLDERREELEQGAGGDYDMPYSFTLPTVMPQVLAWLKLLVRVRDGELGL